MTPDQIIAITAPDRPLMFFGSSGIPHPMNVVAKVIVAIVAVLVILNRSGYSLGL